MLLLYNNVVLSVTYIFVYTIFLYNPINIKMGKVSYLDSVLKADNGLIVISKLNFCREKKPKDEQTWTQLQIY